MTIIGRGFGTDIDVIGAIVAVGFGREVLTDAFIITLTGLEQAQVLVFIDDRILNVSSPTITTNAGEQVNCVNIGSPLSVINANSDDMTMPVTLDEA